MALEGLTIFSSLIGSHTAAVPLLQIVFGNLHGEFKRAAYEIEVIEVITSTTPASLLKVWK